MEILTVGYPLSVFLRFTGRTGKFVEYTSGMTDFILAEVLLAFISNDKSEQQMKNIGYLILFSGFLMVGLARCTDGDTEIGNNWVTVHSRVIVVDTCTVDVSTVLLDSIPTSAGGRVFAGVRRSPLWGIIRASTYMTFSVTDDFSKNSSPEYAEDFRFDSLTLYMVPDSMFCGDTLSRMKLCVYRLTEQVELNDDDELYGHSEFVCEPAALADKEFYPQPLRGKALEIRLPDELGKDFLNLLVDRDEKMDDDDNFRKYFNGLLLKSDDASEAILGFKGSDSICMMKLYYRTAGYSEDEEHVVNFKLDSSLMFTHVDVDRSGTPLEELSLKNEELHSSRSDDKAFAQGLTGIYTKIGFPYLNNLRSLGDHCKAIEAELRIYPLAGSYNKQNYSFLPSTMNLYISDENNISTGSAIVDSEGEDLQTGSFTYDEQFPEKTYYTYDITDFINDQLGKIGVNVRFLQMIDPEYGYTLGELVIGNQNNDIENIELRIKLAIYDEK